MHDLAVVIKSTDSFEDVQGPALACLEKYWPDCPFPVYTTSEGKPWGKLPILVGANHGWSRNLYEALVRIKENYVFLWLDDMLLCESVETEAIQKAYDKISTDFTVGAIRLGPGNETYSYTDEGEFAIIIPESSYRVSTSPTIWRKHYLEKVLTCTGTAWDFELHGTVVSRGLSEKVLAMDPRPMHVLYTAITRGQWEEGALDWLRRVGISVNPTHPIKGYEPGQRWPKQ